MEQTEALVLIAIVLQFAELLLLAALLRNQRIGESGGAPKEKTPSSRETRRNKKLEEESAEVKRLKEVLSDPTRLKDYAIARYKGNVEKAEKEIKEKLRKLTGETFEVPIQK